MRDWEVIKGEGRNSFSVICETSLGVSTIAVKYQDRPGASLDVPDAEAAKRVVENWDGQGSMLDAFATPAAPEPTASSAPRATRRGSSRG